MHFFGFAIDEDGLASTMWGGTEKYAELREEWNTSIQSQLKDYEAMFRSVAFRIFHPSRATDSDSDRYKKMLERGQEGGVQPQVELQQRVGENNREYERRLFAESLRLDLSELFI